MRAIYNVIGLSLCIQGYIHTSNNDVKTPAACVILEFVSNNINLSSPYSISDISIYVEKKGILSEGLKKKPKMDGKVSFKLCNIKK